MNGRIWLLDRRTGKYQSGKAVQPGKLIRKVHGKQEHVHVVGLRGFGGNTEAA